MKKSKKLQNKSEKKLDQIYQSVEHAKKYREPEREPRYFLVNIGSSHFESVEKGKDLNGREYYMDEYQEGVYDPLTSTDLLEIKTWVDSNADYPFVKYNYFIFQFSLQEAMSCMLQDLCVMKQVRTIKEDEEAENLKLRLDLMIDKLLYDPDCLIPKCVLSTILQHANTRELKAFYYQNCVPYTLPSLKMPLTFAYLRFLTNILVRRNYVNISSEYIPYTSVNTVNPNSAFLLTDTEKDRYFTLPMDEDQDQEAQDEEECIERKISTGEFSREDYLDFVSEKANRQYEIYTIKYIMSQITDVADKYVKLKGGEDHSDMFNISFEGGESISIALWNIDLSDKKTPSITINLQREPQQQPLIQIEFEEVNSVLLLEYISDNYYLMDEKYCILAKDFIKEDNLRNIFDRLIWQRYVNTYQ